MGQTRVDLRHLLEDLRDAYPGSVEETILTEIVANSLDSGAKRIALRADPAAATLAVTDDGSGMRRRELACYHDLATSSKTRGKGIGFAGVGVKLGLLVCEKVVTESCHAGQRVATAWSLSGRHKAPWQWLASPPGIVAGQGTAIVLHLANVLSPLLDAGFLEGALRRHFEPLLDGRLTAFLVPAYGDGIAFEVNGERLAAEPRGALALADIAVRLPRRRKAAAAGWLERHAEALPEERRGVAVSTYGKVIKRGWDWLGLTPAQADRLCGLVEAPALAECLTLNKGDFIRTGPRGSLYLGYRRAIQEAVARQLADWGDAPDAEEPEQRRAARPVERDLERVLVNLADDFPMLASLVERRSGGQRRLPMGGAGRGVGVAPMEVRPAGEQGPDAGPTEAATEPAGEPPEPPASTPSDGVAPPAAPMPTGGGARQPARYGLVIRYESRPADAELARLVDTVVWVNDAHPAYARAHASRSEGYHLALCVALALAPLVTEAASYPQFIAAFLHRWGKAVGGKARRHTGSTRRSRY